MAPQPRGKEDRSARAFKVTKKSKRTQTTKQYRFQSFSDRIAKVNIDPVRRTEARSDDFQSSDTTSSHFREALEDWRDKNLTDHFSNFVKEVETLTESLPQILHHTDRIITLLLQYIEDGTSLSLEPLLDLLAQFAHDVGARFESYFEPSVRALSLLARTNQDIEIIERSLNSLVWLFKYLSRLLVADLRPTYDLLAPLLGKEKQKPFIARFAAEALSFLLRKAAVRYDRAPEPLRTFVSHVLADVEEAQDNELYQRAVMTLFFEGIKGVQNGLHSAGLPVVKELLESTKSVQGVDQPVDVRTAVAHGTVTALIHHCTADTFEPILSEILSSTIPQPPDMQDLLNATQSLYVVVGVRKGTRVKSWETVYKRLGAILKAMASMTAGTKNDDLLQNVFKSVAVIFNSSPLEDALRHIGLLEALSQDAEFTKHFFAFCDLFSTINPSRFRSMVLPLLRKHVRSHHAKDCLSVLVLYPRLTRNGLVTEQGPEALQFGSSWEQKITNDFKKLLRTSERETLEEELLYTCNGELSLPLNAVRPSDIRSALGVQIAGSKSVKSSLKDFLWGNCLGAVQTPLDSDNSLWQTVSTHASDFIGLLPFWQNVERLLSGLVGKLGPSDDPTTNMDFKTVLPSAVLMLSVSSHELRFTALRILHHYYTLTKREVPPAVETALSIEQSAFDAQTSRSLSMLIRRLAQDYQDCAKEEWVVKAVPTYLFGLMHVNLSSVWNDAAEAVKVICERDGAHNVVMDLAVRWLIGSEEDSHTSSRYEEDDEDGTDGAMTTKKFYTDYECTNVAQMDDFSRRSWDCMSNVQSRLKESFDRAHHRIPTVNSNCRERVLKILNTVPSVAEKRSRLIVPSFLEWANRTDSAEESEGSDTTITDSSKQRWNRKDQKAMVTLFASMANPKVLYRATEVHEALLALLANGDVELQKPALKALFAWRSGVLERYREDLFNLLDDDRFRDTLAKVQVVGDDIEDPAIRNEDRTELMPVLLRILYGRTIAKVGASAKGGGLDARKKAVFTAIKRFGDSELIQFLAIALGPLQGLDPLSSEEVLSIRKQQGLLNTLKSMIAVLRQDVEPVVDQLVPAVLYCTFSNHSGLGRDEHSEKEESHSLLKDVRQTSLHCLTLLFELFPGYAWQSYMEPLFQRVIGPRLPKLPIETAHSISGLLKMFSGLSQSRLTAPFLFANEDLILPQLNACLRVETAKDDVKFFIIGSVFVQLVNVASDSTAVAAGLRHHGSSLLRAIEHVLRSSPPKGLLDLSVEYFSGLGAFIPIQQSSGLIEISSLLLKQPSGRVPPKIKNRILKALLVLFDNFRQPSDKSTASPLIQIGDAFEATFTDESPEGESRIEIQKQVEDVYECLSSLFSFFEDRESRTVLCEVFEALTRPCSLSSQVAMLCTDLNGFDDSRLDEPAWDLRSLAWAKAASLEVEYTLSQWSPLVWNALFYVRGQEDVFRSSASVLLKRFIDATSVVNQGEQQMFLVFAEQSVLQVIQHGMRNPSEEVRSSLLGILAHAVRKLPEWTVIADMQALLVGADEEEASFFNNVLHIQQHRQLRALRRLAKEANNGVLSSRNVSRIFLPLLDHFVFGQKQTEDESALEAAHSGNLAGEAVTTIGILAQSLDWSQYRALLRRYSGYIREKPEQEKIVMRLLSVLVDAMSQASATRIKGPNGDEEVQLSVLSKSVPRPEKLMDELSKQVLPQLTQYLHDKDETTVSRRAPVAVTVVKLLRLLPEADFANQLPSVLMDLCQILRSKAQESRDLTRKTLAEIVALIGPTYFGFTLKELRRALQRGYQLHVLSFTVHSVLVQVASKFKPGDLDYCIDELVSVIMDDTFGVTGQEKDAEEYVSKMKEVKSSKSYDSMELLASLTSLPYLANLIRPIRLLLLEKLNDSLAKKVDELLRRIRRGLVRNDSVAQQGILVFCHEIWSETYKIVETPLTDSRMDYKTKRYLINMKSAHKAANRGSTSVQTGRLVCFAVDLMRDIIPKNEELQTPAKLTGFLNMIGDAVVSGDEPIRVAVFKLIASLLRVVKVPFPRLDVDAAVYAREAMRVVRDAHSTRTEAAQSALRMVAEILQKRKDTVIRENDAALLLKSLKGDLDEPERQLPAFGFLRAVIARRIIVPEIYEIIDHVARIFVTNHSKETRKLARDTYFAFMMDYPQSKSRLDKQIAYLVKNLSYQYLEGRQSVMEVLHLILTKVGNDLVGTIQDLVFLPLVMTMINDDETECRAFAGILIKDLFERADTARNKSWLKLMQSWVEQSENLALRQAGFQSWELYLEAVPNAAVRTAAFVDATSKILAEYDRDSDLIPTDLIYFALRALSVWVRLNKDQAFAAHLDELWNRIRETHFLPSPWVRLLASQLVGYYLSHFAKTAVDALGLPLIGSQGLQLDQQALLQVARASLMAIQLPDVNRELVDQSTRNLTFVIRCFSTNEIPWIKTARNASNNGHDATLAVNDEDEWSGVSDAENTIDEADEAVPTQSAFDHIIVDLNSVMWRETTTSGPNAALALYPKTAVLKLIETLLANSIISQDRLVDLSPVLLRTLGRLTDPIQTHAISINDELNTAQTNLVESARDLAGQLQDKLGNEQYHAAMIAVKRDATKRRDDRRAKRKLDAINEPERMDLLKRKKRDAAKVRKKVRSQEMRGRRRGW